MMGCDTNFSPLVNDLSSDEPSSRASADLISSDFRVESFDGIFALSKAEPPKNVADDKHGMLAWWNDISSQQLYLYGRLVHTPDDVARALLNLERDLLIDADVLIGELSLTQTAKQTEDQPSDPTLWQPATYALALEIMGYDPSEFLEADKAKPPVTPECVAAKSITAFEQQLKSSALPIKAILLGSQASCGGGDCTDRCENGVECGVPCNDCNICNGMESCSIGPGCDYGPPLECNDYNWCNGLEICVPGSGCQSGTPPICDDDNVCNGLEFCVDNELTTGCQPGTPLVCDDDGNVCNGPEFCDSVEGCKSGPPLLCVDDGTVCNGPEFCDSVEGCKSGPPLNCVDDGNACNGPEFCDSVAGCKSGPPLICDDGDSCNGLETCNAISGCVPGIPKNCDDSDECTIDDCANSACFHTENFDRPHCPDGSCCGDGNPETADSCVCSNPPECTIYDCVHTLVCDDGNPCTVDSCTPDASGSCSENTPCTHVVKPNCAVCGSGYCVSGLCEVRRCRVSLSSVTGCPGADISMNVKLDSCSSASTFCGDNVVWNVSESSPNVSISGMGSISCPSGNSIVFGNISLNASPGSVFVGINGNMGGVGCVNSSNVTIAECVNLTFANVDDADETAVGGFILLNNNDSNNNGEPDHISMTPLGDPDVKTLTINLKASLTGSVNITCVGCNSVIRLYTEQGISEPQLTSLMASDFPINLLVEGISTSGSTKDVEIKAVYTGDGGPCEDKVKLTVLAVKLKAVTFNTDHGLMLDYNNGFGPGQFDDVFNIPALPEPEWIPTLVPPRNNPMSHTMKENVEVTPLISILPANTPELSYQITSNSTFSGFNFVDNNLLLKGGINLPDLTSTSKIGCNSQGDCSASKIEKISPVMSWTLSRDGCTFINETTGPHVTYVTMGIPRDDGFYQHAVTQNRMERAVQQAGAANSLNPHVIVESVIRGQGNFALVNARLNAWDVPDNPSPCESIVRFAEKVAKMINVPGIFEHRNIYAIETDPAIAIEVPSTHGGLNDDPRTHSNGTWIISLVDGDGGCNAFEAAAKFTECGETRFYAGGVAGAILTNKDDVLKVFSKMSWTLNCAEQEVVHTYPPVPNAPPIPTCP